MGELKVEQLKIQDTPTQDYHAVTKEYFEDNVSASYSVCRAKFRKDNGIAAGQSEVPMYEDSGHFENVLVNGEHRLIKTSIRLTAARTAGTLTMHISKNGSKITSSTALELTIDGTHPQENWAEISNITNYEFDDGDKWGIMLTTDGSWDQTTASIEVECYYEVNIDPITP